MNVGLKGSEGIGVWGGRILSQNKKKKNVLFFFLLLLFGPTLLEALENGRNAPKGRRVCVERTRAQEQQ